MFTSFEEIADNYAVILFDAFGVLKSSAGVYDGVPELLASLRERGKDIYVVTNDSSRSPAAMAATYVHPEHGQIFGEGDIISSGLLATDFLRSKVRTGNVTYMGKPDAAYYIESAGLEAIPIADCLDEFAPKALVLLDDEGFDWFRDINRSINLIRRYNIPVIVANADLAYPVDHRDVAIAVGGLANVIESIVGKTFIRFGKPDPLMFSYAFARAQAKNPALTRSDVLMVGDTLSTDIIGANKFGIDTALTLSGNTLPADVEVEIRSSGVIPNYVCESILT